MCKLLFSLLLLKPPRNGLLLPVRRMIFNNSRNSTLQSLKQLQCFHDNSSRIASRYSTSTIKASLIILGLEMAVGFFANTTLFARLRNFGHHRTIYRILLQNLCLIGALSSLIGMPSLFSTIFLSFIQCTQVPAALCRTRYFSLTYAFMTNSINICFLSLDRYDFMCRPFRRRITKDNISRYLAIIWLVPFLVGLLHFVIKIDSTNCVLISSVEGPYSEPMLVLLVVVFVLTCSYVLFTSWSSLKSMRNLAGRLNISKQKRVRSEKHVFPDHKNCCNLPGERGSNTSMVIYLARRWHQKLPFLQRHAYLFTAIAVCYVRCKSFYFYAIGLQEEKEIQKKDRGSQRPHIQRPKR